MANWNLPTITSNYITFVDEVKARDVDAITLQANPASSPPYQSVRLLRSPVKFQDWTGAAFQDLVLSPTGGGTGVTSIAALVPQLGLGSMAYQNANAVSITGGGLTSVNIANAAMSGSASYTGTGFNFNSSGGSIPIYIYGGPGQWAAQMVSPNHGFLITACSGATSENALYVRNAAGTLIGLRVRGDMGVFISRGLVIPVGQGAFVTP